jgi:putative transposase
VRFIDEGKDRRVDGGLRWGVEPICEVLNEHHLKIAPATYYAAKTRPPSARAVRDAALKPVIARVHADNYGVYGVCKMHAALRREGEGIDIGRDRTARLMRELGLAGVRRGKVKRTTIRDDAAGRPADLVNRHFHARRPDQLWVCDLTYIRTWVGFAYLALVIDVFSRRILGWALASHMCAPSCRWKPWSWPSGPVSSSSMVWSTTPTPAARADSSGRRNTSIWRCVHGTTTRLGGGSDGKGCDAVAGSAAGCSV